MSKAKSAIAIENGTTRFPADCERIDLEFGPVTQADAACLLDGGGHAVLAFAEPVARRTGPGFPEVNFRGDIWATVNTMDLAYDEEYTLVFNPGTPEEERSPVDPPWRQTSLGAASLEVRRWGPNEGHGEQLQ